MKLFTRTIAVIAVIGILGAAIVLLKTDPKPAVTSGKPLDVTGRIVVVPQGYDLIPVDLSTSYHVSNSDNPAVGKKLSTLKGQLVHAYGSEIDEQRHAIVILWLNNRKLVDQQLALGTVHTNAFAAQFALFTKSQQTCIQSKIGEERLAQLEAATTLTFTADESDKLNACLMNSTGSGVSK